MKEKARDQNFIHGDRNISYFHRIAKIRAASKNISLLYVGDTIIREPDDTEVHVLNYCRSIFSVDNECISNNLVARKTPSVVTEADNSMLLRFPMCDEIKVVVFDLNGDGARFRIVLEGIFIKLFGILWLQI